MSEASSAACVKWVDLHPGVDPATALPEPSAHSWGFSEADRAALEVALRLAEARGTEAVVVCAGPLEARRCLAELAASGPARAVLVEHDHQSGPGTSGVVLAGVLGPRHLDVDLVVCGDMSNGRGSGSVPAVVAHHLGFAQALGLIELDPGPGTLRAVRRLDGARREVVSVDGPAVLSVEGSVAALRRAPLGAATSAAMTSEAVEVVRTDPHHAPERPTRVVPWRPPPRAVPAPHEADAFSRIVALTGAMADHSPPRSVEGSPETAAELILEQLRTWGYLARDGEQT